MRCLRSFTYSRVAWNRMVESVDSVGFRKVSARALGGMTSRASAHGTRFIRLLCLHVSRSAKVLVAQDILRRLNQWTSLVQFNQAFLEENQSDYFISSIAVLFLFLVF